jgi:phospho-N-acetylmuramoyl-pentapeptide-transferase
MNLTDGLDGLATGTSLIILAGYTILFHDHATLVAILPLIGILVGFLWVNTYPARLFLGDVGSFALGGAIGAIALATGTSLCLVFLAALLVAESVSVILQVTYFRFTGRRIFKISPFHHHFEVAQGIDYDYLLPNVEWPEPKIVTRLWIVQAILVGVGILSVYH